VADQHWCSRQPDDKLRRAVTALTVVTLLLEAAKTAQTTAPKGAFNTRPGLSNSSAKALEREGLEREVTRLNDLEERVKGALPIREEAAG